jgi:LacI family transcriptional regulator
MPHHDSQRASPIDPAISRGSLRHIRRSVLLLLGFYNMPLHLGIARYAREASWALNDTYVRIGHPPVWWRGDGILTLITNPKDVRALENFPDLPLVDLSKGWISKTMPAPDRKSGIGKPRVHYDNAKIGRMAAEHFLQRGFKHIAYLNGGNYWLEMERIPEFRKTVESAGARFHEIEYYKHFTPGGKQPLQDHLEAHQWLTRTIAELPKPLGIAVTADDVAPRLLQACDDAGVAVPEEVGVLGCDNDPMVCDYTPVPLSSVDNDWERIGYEAARLLDQIMNGGTAPKKPVLIPPKGVVTRLSTNILAVPDPQIARALRFIWEHFPESIGTPDISTAAGLNRRTLERGFRLHLGRSVGDELMRVRIERAKSLLIHSTHKAHQIAELSGFSGIVPFSKAFLRVTGVRPSDYRKQHIKHAQL